MKVNSHKSSINLIEKSLLFLVFLFFSFNLFSQLITTVSSPQNLVQNVLLGQGVEVKNITYNGATNAIGMFNAKNTTLGIEEGIIMTTGSVRFEGGQGPIGPNTRANAGIDNARPGYSRLSNLLPNARTTNATVLEFDFVPQSPKAEFKYVFASEEYPEYVNSQFNDIFAFFISGPGINGLQNIANLPNGDVVSINNVNNGKDNNGNGKNSSFFVNNGDGSQAPFNGHPRYIQFDGFTTVLTAKANVQCGETYHLIIAIADVGDANYDSGIFLQAKSLKSDFALNASVQVLSDIYQDNMTIAEGCTDVVVTLERSQPLTNALTVPITISGTAQNGIDYSGIPTTVTFPANSSKASFTIKVPKDAIAEPEESIKITYSFKDLCNRDQMKEINLKIRDPEPMVVKIDQDGKSCINSTVILSTAISGGFGPFTYSWSNGSTNNQITLNESTSGSKNYSVTVKDNHFCGTTKSANITVDFKEFIPKLLSATDTTVCPNTPFKMSATGGEMYRWSPTSFFPDPSQPTVTTKIEDTTFFTVKLFHECGEQEYNIRVNIFYVNFIVSRRDTSICIGNSVPLTASGAESVEWSPATYLNSTSSFTPISVQPQVSITYIALGTTIDGCKVQDTAYIEVVYVPPVPVLADSVRYCIYSNPEVIASGAPKYLWSPQNTVSKTTGPKVNIIAQNSGYTYCLLTNACGSTLDSIYRFVLIPDVTAKPDTSICPKEMVQMAAFGAVNYTWIPFVSYDINNSDTVIVRPKGTTQYRVIGEDINGCFDTAFVDVTVFPLQEVKIKGLDYAEIGDKVELEAITESQGQFQWSPDFEISCTTCQKVIVSPDQTQEYFVEFIDSNGCKTTNSKRIVYPGLMYVPNAFTPDQDRLNRTFFGVATDITEIEMTIYNRWGEVIFDEKGVNPQWDGTKNGIDCKQDTYIWEIKYLDFKNNEVELRGHITLLR